MSLYSLILTIHHIKEFVRLCDKEGKVVEAKNPFISANEPNCL